MWFRKLTGFNEKSAIQIQKNLLIEDQYLISKINGRRFKYGMLEIPSLSKLKQQIQLLCPTPSNRHITLQECVADIQDLHLKTENNGALFQVASQCNLLEMVSPRVTPEAGIDGYEHDLTQGPACAIAAGAGTIYRNYFVELDGQIGQSAAQQIDTLADMGKALNNQNNRLWEMKNGYALASSNGLDLITAKLTAFNALEREQLKGMLKVGIQWDTEVTLSTSKNQVSQVYCSALPVQYSRHSSQQWQAFACLVLEAAYEATLCAAILNHAKTGNPNVYLTLLGGGAFGNQTDWIINAIHNVLKKYRYYSLNIFIVSYRNSNPDIKKLIKLFNI